MFSEVSCTTFVVVKYKIPKENMTFCKNKNKTKHKPEIYNERKKKKIQIVLSKTFIH